MLPTNHCGLWAPQLSEQDNGDLFIHPVEIYFSKDRKKKKKSR